MRTSVSTGRAPYGGDVEEYRSFAFQHAPIACGSVVIQEISYDDDIVLQEAFDDGEGGFIGHSIREFQTGHLNYDGGICSNFRFHKPISKGSRVMAYYAYIDPWTEQTKIDTLGIETWEQELVRWERTRENPLYPISRQQAERLERLQLRQRCRNYEPGLLLESLWNS